jgi:hypothetical protein
MEGDVLLIPLDITPGVLPTPSKFGPLLRGHPGIGATCLLCQEPLRTADYTATLSLGPGADEDAQAGCRAGRPYHGIGVVVHWGCGTGKLDYDLELPN